MICCEVFKMAYRLVDIRTGKVLQVCEGDFKEFLDTKWGGMYPFKLPNDNRLHTSRGKILGCHHYDAYWEEV
jgi:hypothetical protein